MGKGTWWVIPFSSRYPELYNETMNKIPSNFPFLVISTILPTLFFSFRPMTKISRLVRNIAARCRLLELDRWQAPGAMSSTRVLVAELSVKRCSCRRSASLHAFRMAALQLHHPLDETGQSFDSRRFDSAPSPTSGKFSGCSSATNPPLPGKQPSQIPGRAAPPHPPQFPAFWAHVATNAFPTQPPGHVRWGYPAATRLRKTTSKLKQTGSTCPPSRQLHPCSLQASLTALVVGAVATQYRHRGY